MRAVKRGAAERMVGGSNEARRERRRDDGELAAGLKTGRMSSSRVDAELQRTPEEWMERQAEKRAEGGGSR